MNNFWSVVSLNSVKIHKITNYSIKDRGNTPILTIHIKFEANPCSGLREVKYMYEYACYITTHWHNSVKIGHQNFI